MPDEIGMPYFLGSIDTTAELPKRKKPLNAVGQGNIRILLVGNLALLVGPFMYWLAIGDRYDRP